MSNKFLHLFYLGLIILSGNSLVFAQSNCSDKWNLVEEQDTELYIIDSTKWSYPWYIIKHENGFENTFGREIVKQDTMPILHNSSCQVSLEGISYKKSLPFAKASLINDTLKLFVFDESASNFENVSITITNNTFLVCYDKAYISNKKLKSVEFIKSKLKISQLAGFELGRKLYGSLELELIEATNNAINLQRTNYSRKKVIGSFEVVIE